MIEITLALTLLNTLMLIILVMNYKKIFVLISTLARNGIDLTELYSNMSLGIKELQEMEYEIYEEDSRSLSN